MGPIAVRIAWISFRMLKRVFKLFGVLVLFAIVVTAVVIIKSGDSDFRYPRPAAIVNDITGLNPIHVGRVVTPSSIEEVVEAVLSSEGTLSIGGGRFSQGGQVAYPESLHFDMRGFDRVIALDAKRRRVTVQSGITWRKLQEHIDPHDLSIKIMQTYANFTVGGSLSVNVHGRYLGEGPLVRSVESIRIVLADGALVSASPTENTELFYGAIGGYGGLGVIVEATLQLEINEPIERRTKTMPIDEYREYFASNIRDNHEIVFHNADIYPPAYENVRDVSWYKTDQPVTIEDRLIPVDTKYSWQPVVARFVAASDVGKRLREHVFEPLYYLEDRIAWRNWEASYDVRELELPSRDEYTYVLREYFVPVNKFDTFVPRMAEIFRQHEANIVNVSVRHALPDPGTLLAWAREEVFAFVVYYRQGTDSAAMEAVKAWSVEMIDAVIDAGGTWYLPYQIFANPAQFLAGYPRSPEYFALKRRIDPDNRFRNRLWEQHYPENRDPLDTARAKIKDYFRGEEQTFLTVPEWYLVFNPKEYADHLQGGNNPSDFPFFASIQEYWALYDRVTVVADANDYPKNRQYLTMLWVIGTSTSFEYVIKGLYENTVGRFTRWTASGENTPEDLLIQQAHRAYSDLIFSEAWYEFDFASWLRSIWFDSGFFGRGIVRKIERKLFFTAEFGIKTVYAKLIEWAAESTYGETDRLIYLTAIESSSPEIDKAISRSDRAVAAPVSLPEQATIIASEGGEHLIAVPRWGGFTDTVPKLAKAGYDFRDISGNQRIVISLIVNEDAPVAGLPATQLFISEVVSNESLKRMVMVVKVAELGQFLRDVDREKLLLEHIYDY